MMCLVSDLTMNFISIIIIIIIGRIIFVDVMNLMKFIC